MTISQKQGNWRRKFATLILTIVGIFALSLPSRAQAAHSATLSWVDGKNPSGVTYSVYRATGLCSGTPSFSKLATAITVLTYVDSTVTPGNYCFEVTATVNSMESAPSNTAAGPVPSFSPSSLAVTVAMIEVRIPHES